ncbi:MAG: ROK family protein [Propionicimonas sp.]
MSVIGAVDIGGSKIAAGIIDEDSHILARRSAPTPASEGPAAVLAVAAHLIREASIDAGVEPVAVGVGTAGVVDAGSGMILGATAALSGWTGTPVASALAAQLGLPVHVENDVTAFLLGEAVAGAAVGLADVIAITVGTGIGGALLVGGQVVRGHTCVAGNIGHVPSPEAGDRRCPCGRRGHLEAFASGPAMTAVYRERSGQPVPDLREVALRARSGDELAEEVLRAGAAAVGRIVGGLVNVLNPALILLGGGVLAVGSWYVEAVAEAMSREVLAPLDAVPVRAAVLGGDAMLVGAAAAARAAGAST